MLYIIIPYRQRQDNLTQFLNTMLPIFKNNLDDFRIIIVEQGNNKPFNRGLLFNVAVKHFVKNRNDEIILHDVDTLPKESVITTCYKPRLPDNLILGIYSYENTIGGITKLNKFAFERVNGFPTNYWGWGYEDTVLKKRVDMANINHINKYTPKTPSIKSYFTLLEEPVRESGLYQKGQVCPNEIFTEYFDQVSIEKKIKIIERSGLCTTHYNVMRHLKLDNEPLVELLTVDI